MRHRPRLLIVLFTILAGLGVYGFVIEPSSLRVRSYDLSIEHADDASLKGLRIAVIGDLHAGAPYIGLDKVRKVVRLTNQSHPDLTLLTGDYVVQDVIGGQNIPIEQTAAVLRGLSAPLGVYAVLGNHDHWGDAERIAEALRGAGIVVLENDSIVIDRGGRFIRLVGIGDDYSHYADPDVALANVPRDARALCFTHSPDVFPELPGTCLLTIASHTHGGQVVLPFFGRPVTHSRYGQRYVLGLTIERGRYLFVNTGIGTSSLPIRFGVPPEISILNIR